LYTEGTQGSEPLLLNRWLSSYCLY